MIYGRLVSLYVSREQSYKLRGSSSNTSSLSSLSGAAPEVSKCVFSFIGEFWFLCFAFLNCLYSEMIVVEPSIPTMKSKLQDIVNKTLDEMISVLTSQMSSRYQSFSLFLNSQPILSSSSPLIRETTDNSSDNDESLLYSLLLHKPSYDTIHGWSPWCLFRESRNFEKSSFFLC